MYFDRHGCELQQGPMRIDGARSARNTDHETFPPCGRRFVYLSRCWCSHRADDKPPDSPRSIECEYKFRIVYTYGSFRDSRRGRLNMVRWQLGFIACHESDTTTPVKSLSGRPPDEQETPTLGALVVTALAGLISIISSPALGSVQRTPDASGA